MAATLKRNDMDDLTATKLCKDCAFFRPPVYGWWIFKSRGPDHLSKCAQTVDPVTGGPKEFCEFKRESMGSCGPDGKLWAAIRDRSDK